MQIMWAIWGPYLDFLFHSINLCMRLFFNYHTVQSVISEWIWTSVLMFFVRIALVVLVIYPFHINIGIGLRVLDLDCNCVVSLKCSVNTWVINVIKPSNPWIQYICMNLYFSLRFCSIEIFYVLYKIYNELFHSLRCFC